MNIIHYCFGLPPYASGGLTKYAIDLFYEESKNHNVFIMLPYKYKKELRFKIKGKKILFYSSLPCSLTYGVKEPDDFIKKMNPNKFEELIKKLKIDVFHIHTIQGLYLEFLEVLKKLNVKIIFTAHDFYPISLSSKYYLDKEQNDLNNVKLSLTCPSTKKLYLSRSPFINGLKKFKFFKKIFNKKKNIDVIITEEYKNNYLEKSKKLYDYYLKILKLCDVIHYNSKLTSDIYKKYIDVNSVIIPITHSDIKINDVKKSDSNILRIGFFGEQREEKGYNLLIDVLDNIDGNFKLLTYGKDNLIKRSYIDYKGPYEYDDLKDIYKNIDVVLVPSTNIESFGFVVIEALANKTAVIVSNNVGSKDLVNPNYIFNNKEELSILLNNLVDDKNRLNDYFNYDLKIKSFSEHVKEVEENLYV